MTAADIHAILSDRFGASKVTKLVAEARDPWIEVSADSIVEVGLFLRDDPRFLFDHLNDLCGVDFLEPDPKKAAKFGHEPHLEVVYHLSSMTLKHRLVVKARLTRWKNDAAGQIPECPSVSDVWAIADWHEREAYDMFGIDFLGHPNLRRILCPEDWEGYPLRKDYEFPLEYHGVRGR